MSNQDLSKLTIAEMLAGLRNKNFSATELVDAHLAQIIKHQNFNAYITVTAEAAKTAAKATDERIAKNEMRKLEGIPLGIKDSFCTKDVLTTAGSKMLYNFVPPYESTVTNKLKEAGAIMLGKLNCDEFAMGSGNLTSHFGPVTNPWRSSVVPELPLVPGGSSGGSAAAVASFMAAAALGTDTGGSVRQPASFTGTVGVKPTYGRCSRFGIIAFASSLDQAGIITRTVQDAALMLENMMGFCPQDSTSVNLEVPNLSQAITEKVRGIKIGIPINLFKNKSLSSEISNIWQRAASLLVETAGAQIVEIGLPNIDYALPTYYILAPAEASANLARYDGVRYGLRVEQEGMSLEQMYEATRSEGFGDEVKRRIMIGNYVLSSGFIDAYYIKAQKVRRLIINDFKQAFNEVDVILMPTAPTAAFPLDIVQDDPTNMYLNDIFTIPPSLAGLPAMSIPTALSSENLPLGMQIVGKAFDEYTMFKVATALERAVNTKFIPGGF